jgi:hypothetical protein
MKQRLLLSTLFIASSLPLFAQKVHFGQEAGITMSNVSPKVASGYDYFETDGKLGLRVGAFAHLNITPHLNVEGGLYYNQAGFKENYSYNTAENQVIRRERYDYRLHYIQIPLSVGYTIKAPFGSLLTVSGGPYAALALAGHLKYSADRLVSLTPVPQYQSGGTDASIALGNGRADQFRKFDCGLQGSVTLKGPCRFFVRGTGSIGAFNILSRGTSDYSLKNRMVSVTLGYML